jgi:hypothetical protein
MATYTNFDVPFFADNALQGFVNTLVPINAFSTNFSSAAERNTGSNVLVPLIGSLTATTFTAYNVCGGTASVITVTLNKRKIVLLGQDDLTAANNAYGNNLGMWAYQQGVALAYGVLQDIWTLLTTQNFAIASTVASGSFTIAEIRKGRLQLNTNKAPMEPRSLVLDNVPYDALLGTSLFQFAQGTGSAMGVREGSVGRALGCDVFETNSLPGTNSVMGFIAHASAMAVAMRYLAPQRPDAYIEARPVTDPASGLTFGLRHLYDFNTGTEYLDIEALYGYSAGITNGARLFGRTD